MGIRQLVISQKDSSQKFYFNRKSNIVISNSLSDDLLKPNYFNGENQYVVEDENGNPIESIFQFIINLKDVGVFVAYFDRSNFNDENKEALITKLQSLKDKGETTLDNQKNKIPVLLKMLEEDKPLFVCFSNTSELILTRAYFDDLLTTFETSYPILILMQSLTSLLESSDPQKKQKKFAPVVKKEEKPREVKKEPTIKEPKEKKEHRSFKETAKSLYCLDFLFFMIFSAFIAFSGVGALHRMLANEGIGVFLIVMMVLFILTLNYATYRSYKEEPKFQYKLPNLILLLSYIVIGVALGIVIGYIVVTNAFKADPEKPIDTMFVLAVMIPSTSIVAILSAFTPIPLSKLFSKMKKKN